LSNGARVLIKPTDFKADEIRLSGGSDGGISLVKDDEYLSASVATAIASISGAGRHSAVELQKKLTGKAVNASAGIGDYSESVSGFAAPADLETMFQLLYIRIEEPRLDADAWNAAKDRVLTALANRKASPELAWRDTIDVVMSQHDFRSRPLTASMVETIEADRAIAFYKSRFADFSDWTFSIVGNVKLGELKPLVETYLASLPSIGRNETWKDVGKPAPRGVIENTLRRGTEDKANTEFIFTGPFKYTADNRFVLGALVSVLRNRLIETLREQLGRTYSPSVGGGGGRIPREEYTISIGYPSSPESLEKLKASVFAVIDTLKTRGPTQADIDKIREASIRSRETAVKTNAYWMGVLSSRTESIDDYLKNTALSAERMKNLTPAQIQEAAKLYLDIQNYAHFVLLPAK
jgi:zinc protease